VSFQLVLLGCYCIFFGFIGFNGGSQLHISQPGDGAVLGQVVVNTFVSGAFGGVSATLMVALAHRRFSLGERQSAVVAMYICRTALFYALYLSQLSKWRAYWHGTVLVAAVNVVGNLVSHLCLCYT